MINSAERQAQCELGTANYIVLCDSLAAAVQMAVLPMMCSCVRLSFADDTASTWRCACSKARLVPNLTRSREL